MIVNKEYRQDLIQLAKEYKFSSQSYPADEDGEPKEAYLEYLSLMYDPEIIKIMLYLPIFPKMSSVAKLAKELTIDKAELIAKLEPYAKKGFVLKIGKSYTRPSPLLIYDAPFIVKENYEGADSIKFAQLSRNFFEDNYYKTWETSRKGIPRTRVLTVSEKVDPSHEILPIEEVYKIIDAQTDFALIPCPCRNRKEIEGIRECKGKYPIHNCIVMSGNAQALLEMGDPVIKPVTKEEVKELTKQASELGLIHMTDNHAERTNIICSCCECCCGNLAGLIRFYDNPRAFAKANFISAIDEDLCTACETCVERCKFNAIDIDDFAHINPEKCVGCGLCAVKCPNDAITMKKYEREPIPGLA